MPVYEFKCKVCDTVYEFGERDVDTKCCDEPLVRLYSIGGISFKGSGFYATDNK